MLISSTTVLVVSVRMSMRMMMRTVFPVLVQLSTNQHERNEARSRDLQEYSS